jgi:3-oxoacyl-[acyl-carrier-protein] synthase II
MTLKRVVVTGLGALTPIGNTLPEYWEGLRSGKSGAAPITHFDASKYKTRFACEIKNFDIGNHMDRKEARKMDPFAQYAMVAVDEAIIDSNLPLASLDPDRVGVIWGSGIGGLLTFQEEVKSYAKGDGTPRFNPFFIPKMIPDLSAGHISIKYGFRGPNFVTVSACASSTNAIYDAFTYLRLGKADIIVSEDQRLQYVKPALVVSRHESTLERETIPETASRPYDHDRDGFV